jgi:hypothetical protein
MQKQWHPPHREVSPLSLFPHAVHLRARFPVNSAPQPSIPQAVDGDNQVVFHRLDFGHAVGFQAQLFSDKRFNEHLGSFPFYGLCGNNPKGSRTRGASLFSSFNSSDSHGFDSNYTFWTGTEKWIVAEPQSGDPEVTSPYLLGSV